MYFAKREAPHPRWLFGMRWTVDPRGRCGESCILTWRSVALWTRLVALRRSGLRGADGGGRGEERGEET